MHYPQVFNDEEIAELERTDEPEKRQTPTYEDIERELGYDCMSFISEMLRPDEE
jgi:hypothetical protein